MKIQRQDRAKLVNPYAVDFFDIKGAIQGICASGSNGGCVMFPLRGDGYALQNWSEPNGGAQVFKQISGDNFYAIQGFFPEFRCENARVVLAKRVGDNDWKIAKCFDLPFVHKFTVITVKGVKFMLAATLSGPKKFKEDWTCPGQVVIARVPANPTKDHWDFNPLITGLNKNHGFWEGEFEGHKTLLFSAVQGLFTVEVPENPEGEWKVSRILDHEISDISVYDLDGDGQDEIVAINGFHGDELAVYHRKGSGYEKVFSYHIDYGHTVWAGELFGTPSIFAGELFGEARIVLLQPVGSSKFDFCEVYAESGVGPFSVKVRKNDGGDYDVICPASEAGGVLLYRIGR